VKIDPTPVESTARGQATGTVSNSRAGGASSFSIPSEDAARVSSIGSLAAKVGNTSEERIRELRKQVLKGSYSVPAAEVSRKIAEVLGPEEAEGIN